MTWLYQVARIAGIDICTTDTQDIAERGNFESNLLVGMFNLLPTFPLDGGRALRAFLRMKLGYSESTRIAQELGQRFALLVGGLGLVHLNYALTLSAVFIFFRCSTATG